MMRSILAMALAALCFGASDDPCDSCQDRWAADLAAGEHRRHQGLVEAGKSYEIILAPADANADLIVSADGDWPPEPIACRSAIGGTAVDRCTFEATANGPLYVFVIGGERATRYRAGIAHP